MKFPTSQQVAVCVGAATGNLGKLTTASAESARTAVEIAIGLVGPMALWLGLVKVLEEAGLMRSLPRDAPPRAHALSAHKKQEARVLDTRASLHSLSTPTLGRSQKMKKSNTNAPSKRRANRGSFRNLRQP